MGEDKGLWNNLIILTVVKSIKLVYLIGFDKFSYSVISPVEKCDKTQKDAKQVLKHITRIRTKIYCKTSKDKTIQQDAVQTTECPSSRYDKQWSRSCKEYKHFWIIYI